MIKSNRTPITEQMFGMLVTGKCSRGDENRCPDSPPRLITPHKEF